MSDLDSGNDFVSIPASALEEDMVTSDGQTVLDAELSSDGQHVIYHVFTECEDPEEYDFRVATPETRMARLDEPISVFADSVPEPIVGL